MPGNREAEGSFPVTRSKNADGEVAERSTRPPQKRLSLRSCGFESHLPYVDPSRAELKDVLTFERGPLRGEVRVAGDKSISHRALMLAAFANGRSVIAEPNRGEDVLATRDAVAALGALVDDRGDTIVVTGGTLHDPAATIDARNSGTTTRLLMGMCAGHGITARFDGDASLRRRPMERVARPLRALGADVQTNSGRLPATVRGISNPPGGDFALEIASAQVKSAILFANLNARGRVRITGDESSRDHTERLLRRLGRAIEFDGRTIELEPGPTLARDCAHSGRPLGRRIFPRGRHAHTRQGDLLLR